MEDATIVRSDYVGPGEGVIVFEGTNSVNGESFQMVWSPGFDLEEWYWANGGGPSSPNAFWTSDQDGAETYQAVCYAPGTLIDTPDGPVPVEALQPCDLVETLDNSAVQIRWIRHDDQPLESVKRDEKPVLISAGSLGSNQPSQDLVVSPQHRILVGGVGHLKTVFTTEAFAPAKSLTSLPGIRHMKGKTQITWVHFACDRHEVVTANGCLSESLLLGPMVVNGLTIAERQELTAICGTAPKSGAALNGPAARECLKVGEVRRHLVELNKENPRATAKEINRWDLDLAMERWEAEQMAHSLPNCRKTNLRLAS
jgi:hypothetical protein